MNHFWQRTKKEKEESRYDGTEANSPIFTMQKGWWKNFDSLPGHMPRHIHVYGTETGRFEQDFMEGYREFDLGKFVVTSIRLRSGGEPNLGRFIFPAQAK